MSERTCVSCGTPKALQDFGIHARGLSRTCRPCMDERKAARRKKHDTEYRYAWRAKNRDRLLEARRVHRRENQARTTLESIRARSKKRGIPFALTLSDIPPLPSHCPALGIKLEPGRGGPHDASPSLDRIVPSLGYVPGNVAWLSQRANSIKQNATATEIQAVAAWLNSLA